MLGRREAGLGAYRDVRDDGRPTEDDAARRASPRPARSARARTAFDCLTNLGLPAI